MAEALSKGGAKEVEDKYHPRGGLMCWVKKETQFSGREPQTCRWRQREGKERCVKTQVSFYFASSLTSADVTVYSRVSAGSSIKEMFQIAYRFISRMVLTSQAQWCMRIIPAPGQLRQEDGKFTAP